MLDVSSPFLYSFFPPQFQHLDWSLWLNIRAGVLGLMIFGAALGCSRYLGNFLNISIFKLAVTICTRIHSVKSNSDIVPMVYKIYLQNNVHFGTRHQKRDLSPARHQHLISPGRRFNMQNTSNQKNRGASSPDTQ
jgi:hypothetical protein